jgi:hypothetical protein
MFEDSKKVIIYNKYKFKANEKVDLLRPEQQKINYINNLIRDIIGTGKKTNNWLPELYECVEKELNQEIRFKKLERICNE